MIAPQDQGQSNGSPSGTSIAPITIRALNDGQVLIDGQAARETVAFRGNTWIVVEGINARDAKPVGDVAAPFHATGASGNITFRRVIGWNAAMTDNTYDIAVFQFNGSGPFLCEDCAGFGFARKIFSCSQGGNNHCTFRRTWGRWEGYGTGSPYNPKLTLTAWNNNKSFTLENGIMTWSAERQVGTPTEANAVIGLDGGSGGDEPLGSKVLGSIAYLKAGVSFPPVIAGVWGDADGFTFDHVVSYAQGSLKRFDLRVCSWAFCSGASRVAQNLTGIGGAASTINAQWTGSNRAECATVSGSCANIYTGATGANICKRYVGGTLGNEALWPWPMDDRIKAALATAGSSALAGTAQTVTSEIESIFGAIPAGCKSS